METEREVNDLDLSIALRKGVRSCTQHSIHNDLTYLKLSTQYRAFTANVDSIDILGNIENAL